MKEKIIVFSGPTISHQEIHEILPEALCHAPIKCGDILKVLRLSPKIIVIIDGNFGHVGSAWHKEIMLALSHKITVFGVASMGALRAAELDDFGMKGHGEIYHFYKIGQINGDDEVAIIHADNDKNYQITTLALVNIRCTLNKAMIEGKASQQIVNNIIGRIKNLPYFERTFARVADIIQDKSLINWFRNNYIDQKKLDAVSLLRYLNYSNKAIENDVQPLILNNTFYLRKLYREMTCSHFDFPYEWLPEIEKRVYHLHDKTHFKHFVLLAKLLHIAYDISEKDHQILNTEMFIENIKNQIENDKVKRVLQYYLLYVGNSKEDISVSTSLLNTIAFLIEYVIGFFEKNKIKLNSMYANEFFAIYRRNNHLLKAEDLRQWLEINNMSDRSHYGDFLLYATILYYIVEQGNVDYINIRTSMNNIFWLGEVVNIFDDGSF